MQTTIGDRRVGYESHGEGLPLLLLHGFPLDRTMFHDQNLGLAPFARVLTFDVPGVGASEPAPLSMESIADTAAGLLDALGLKRAVVGGVSMGGYAALAFARRHPHRLSGLVLANTRAAADSDTAREGRRETAAAALRDGSDAIARGRMSTILGATARRKNPKLVERVRAMIAGVRPEVIAELAGALGRRLDSTELLERIAVPTLVVCAEEDELTPTGESRAWAVKIPGVDLVEICKAGHLANMEAPESFNAAVAAFLRKL